MSIRPLERIADDAVEAVSYGREQTQWLAAPDIRRGPDRSALALARCRDH